MTQYTYLPSVPSSRLGDGTLTRSSLPRAACCRAASFADSALRADASAFAGGAAFLALLGAGFLTGFFAAVFAIVRSALRFAFGTISARGPDRLYCPSSRGDGPAA